MTHVIILFLNIFNFLQIVLTLKGIELSEKTRTLFILEADGLTISPAIVLDLASTLGIFTGMIFGFKMREAFMNGQMHIME